MAKERANWDLAIGRNKAAYTASSSFNVCFVADDAAFVTCDVKAAAHDHGTAVQLDSYATLLWMQRDGVGERVLSSDTRFGPLSRRFSLRPARSAAPGELLCYGVSDIGTTHDTG